MSKVDIVEVPDEKAAHSILNSIMTQVAVTKKSYKTKFKISYLELMKGIGEDDSFADVDLQVEISCKWVEADYEEEDIVIEETEDGGEAYES